VLNDHRLDVTGQRPIVDQAAPATTLIVAVAVIISIAIIIL